MIIRALDGSKSSCEPVVTILLCFLFSYSSLETQHWSPPVLNTALLDCWLGGPANILRWTQLHLGLVVTLMVHQSTIINRQLNINLYLITAKGALFLKLASSSQWSCGLDRSRMRPCQAEANLWRLIKICNFFNHSFYTTVLSIKWKFRV